MEKKRGAQRGVAPKIDVAAALWFEATFSTLNAGATWALENFPHLYRAALAELRGRFERGELCMMIDVMNGTMALMAGGAAGLAGQHLPLSMQDSFDLYPGAYEEKWGIAHKSGTMGRIRNLTRFQVVALEVWAASFWEREDYQADNAIGDHLKPLQED